MGHVYMCGICGRPERTYQHHHRFSRIRHRPSQRGSGRLDPEMLVGEQGDGEPVGDEAGPDDGLARPGGRHAMRRAESARTAYCWFGWLLLCLFMVEGLTEGGGVRGWVPARAVGLTGPDECSIRTCPALFHDPCQAYGAPPAPAARGYDPVRQSVRYGR